MSLREYKKKRSFDKTKEPIAKVASSKSKDLFVIQKHQARKLHYDLRLEVNGKLKSWAVPKGISKSPAIKRLAIQTEDHPLAYAKFHGIIPKGEYGAGKMEIWDKGQFINLKKKALSSCIREGRCEFLLKGKKAKGGFALIRTKDKNWLLIKMNDKKLNERVKKDA